MWFGLLCLGFNHHIYSKQSCLKNLKRKPKTFFNVVNAYTNIQCNDPNGIENILMDILSKVP